MIPEGTRVKGVLRRTGEVMRPPAPRPAFPVLDRLFCRHDITDVSTGDLYLTRWIVFRCRWFRVFIHRIWRADKDRNLHSHPWRAICIVLWGWYRQKTVRMYSGRSSWPWYTIVRNVNILRTDEYHRITDVSPSLWTLCIAGRRYREWGFLVNNNNKHVDWRTYLNLPENAELKD